jgi:hypothetical protein
MSPMPPMPPMPPGGMGGAFGFGFSATIASVVTRSPATELATIAAQALPRAKQEEPRTAEIREFGPVDGSKH